VSADFKRVVVPFEASVYCRDSPSTIVTSQLISSDWMVEVASVDFLCWTSLVFVFSTTPPWVEPLRGRPSWSTYPIDVGFAGGSVSGGVCRSEGPSSGLHAGLRSF
jgi:hypothetical protein